MALSNQRVKAVVTCVSCGAVLGAEIASDGTITPLGSADACGCGNGSEFRRLR